LARGGIAAMAMSALDIALWDAVGNAPRLPLHRLWGIIARNPDLPARAVSAAPPAADGMIEKALHSSRRATRRSRWQVAHVTRKRKTSTMCAACARRSAPTSTS